MAKYIKSHSNYRLSKKHQETSNGKILERDISTIGGVDTFATGQSTIYSTGNFVITTNNSSSPSRHVAKTAWLGNTESGDTWTEDVLANYTSDVNGSVESSITMKNDFMDLRSFSCYGSLTTLVQSSISDIIDKFPYEIYTSDGDCSYNLHHINFWLENSEFNYDATVNTSSNSVSAQTNFVEFTNSGSPVSYFSGDSSNYYEISNPAGIDMHTTYIDEITVGDELKYFANGGFENYSIISDNDENPTDGYDFLWNVTRENEFTISSVDADGTATLTSTTFSEYARTHIILRFTNSLHIKKINTGIKLPSGETLVVPFNRYVNAGDVLYVRVKNNRQLEVTSKYCPSVGDYVATIRITIKGLLDDSGLMDTVLNIYAVRGEDLEVKYLVKRDGLFYHIRPRESLSYYDNFIDSLNMFGKTLMGIYSGKKNVAKFEILSETDNSIKKEIRAFTFPTGDGGYNIETEGSALSLYISTLGKIAMNYDEIYTDNMYRLMTHESLKNFDWTKDFNGNGGDLDNEYVTTGEKFKSIIRVMGYAFDQEKAYIDCIGNTMTVTYDNRSNLPDYFLSDSLEVDGWDVTTIYPFNLKQYSREDGREIGTIMWDDESQRTNRYKRTFSENTTDIITPYASIENATYWSCVNGSMQEITLEEDNGQTYFNEDGKIKKITREYSDSVEWTIPDINNAFLKRLRLNSKQLLRKKGTVDGIESMLGLFGFKSRRWFESLNTTRTNGKFETKYGANLTKKIPFDFDIKEYVEIAHPIKETWDVAHDNYTIDFYNSCKTIPYNTESYINGIYINYQGLPVAYRDLDNTYLASKTESGTTIQYETTDVSDSNIIVNSNGELVKARRLYPDFESNGIYDGDMFYQMNGGWLNYWPYKFDLKNDVVINYSGTTCTETLRNVKQTENIESLLSVSMSDLSDNIIFYVNDLSTNYAIIDGQIYELIPETDSTGAIYYYFTVSVYENAVSIGNNLFTDYLEVSNPDSTDNRTEYYLLNMSNGEDIKVYYMPNNAKPFRIRGYESVTYYKNVVTADGLRIQESCTAYDDGAIAQYNEETIPERIEVFFNENYNGYTGIYSHYFKLKQKSEANVLGGDGWNQLRYTDSDYLRVNGIEDNYKGNNPHSGGYGYDNGHEYLYRFSKLFKYPLENDLFNENCFIDKDATYEKIESIGFSGLTNRVETNKDYTTYLVKDNKVHHFCDVLDETSDETNEGQVKRYYKANGGYKTELSYLKTKPYNKDDVESISSISEYEKIKEYSDADGVTNQIVNIKVIEISFYLKSENFYSKECQEEVKYIQSVVMPYVEQLLPSTIIPRIKYYVPSYNWVYDKDDTYDDGTWHSYFYWTENGIWPNT